MPLVLPNILLRINQLVDWTGLAVGTHAVLFRFHLQQMGTLDPVAVGRFPYGVVGFRVPPDDWILSGIENANGIEEVERVISETIVPAVHAQLTTVLVAIREMAAKSIDELNAAILDEVRVMHCAKSFLALVRRQVAESILKFRQLESEKKTAVKRTRPAIRKGIDHS